jgi:hypothetical protein
LNFPSQLRPLIRCVWIAAGVGAASAAVATPSGSLGFASVPNGTVNLSATRIDFSPPANPSSGAAGTGDFATGATTVLSYSGGVLTSATNPYGQLRDITLGAGTLTDFIRFYTAPTLPAPPGNGTLQTNPAFDLTALVPGGSAQGALNDCAGVTAVGVSCSPLITAGGGSPFVSPLVLTNRGTFTVVAFGMTLVARDATGSAPAVGGFTTHVFAQGATRLTPAAIQTILNSGGTISSTYSASINVPAAAAP